MSMTDELVIDESLYSRQQIMMGEAAMKRMATSNVFLSGISGLGVEIAKNIALAGVKSLTLHDQESTSWLDLSTNFYLTSDDIGRNRAEACFPKIHELNPYTKCSVSNIDLNGTDLSSLDEYKCVILVDFTHEQQAKVNDYCHSKNICFISAESRGVFTWAFCDFGSHFEVFDKNGEESKEVLVGRVTKSSDGIVSTLNDARHDLEDGDTITFREVIGMDQLNGTQFKIKVLSPTTFSIGDTSSFGEYARDGIATQVKTVTTVSSSTLRESAVDPSIVPTDFAKLESGIQMHLGQLAIHRFARENGGNLPNPWNRQDSAQVLRIAAEVNRSMKNPVEQINEDIIEKMSWTFRGSIAPLSSFTGGVVAQECLKALSGKYTPLNQWTDPSEFQPTSSRYDAQRICFGNALNESIQKTKIFMVGCGAIGCEMMKNYALLGLGCAPTGSITVTDNDLIEKSNLNRQFLFRAKDIQQPKSETACKSASNMNSALQLVPLLDKVGPDTESKFNDEFFRTKDVIVNALDNIEARRYVDSRCVTNGRPLIESGTLGPKGHVQVVVPFMTESYGSSRDPPEKDVPFCTLKSFPNVIEHCVEWARDFSFGGILVDQPMQWNQLVEETDLMTKLKQPFGGGLDLKRVRTSAKLVQKRPRSFHDCIAFARRKFESYFKNKSLQLLHAFPLDHKTDDKGTLFWSSPKRPPKVIEFDFNDVTHRSFVVSLARLYSEVWDLPYSVADLTLENIEKGLSNVELPTFVPLDKEIITDESVKKPEEKKAKSSDEEIEDNLDILYKYFSTNGPSKLKPVDFEKDNDGNGHIDFIGSTSNLRARMYAIPEVDRLKIKAIAGRIMPAIATTTASISGCASLELVKLILHRQKEGGSQLSDFKNLFMNLALPFWAFSEPGTAPKTKLAGDKFFTAWDRWDVNIGGAATMNQFLEYFQQTHHLNVAGVFKGAVMVFVPMFPAHKKRKTMKMSELLKPKKGAVYEDLIVTFENDAGEDVSGPPVRFYY
ncbi:ubiquitin-like modifier activating enzyme 6 [Planoprotostelium fungivorum]|uniref:E1 ubiquitin-activating enzyme n=1 Tax=Planoprotostelium fungivorum TaxID=1890364 RepID=A0A2P6NIY2_9EUKA|nr:ubiquitin-like modifier activating enzyme 6 [Planoprotostelium fungivorum]